MGGKGEKMSISKGKQEKIRVILAANPSTMPAKIADEVCVTELEVVKAYPEEMSVYATIAHFEVIWEEMAKWEKVTFIASNNGIIAEIKGKLSKGSIGHGYFNLFDKNAPLNGHIRIDELDAIYFISKPFMKMESHSVQFFDKSGNQVFSVYVGRDNKRQLLPEVLTSFMKLKEMFSGKTNKAHCGNGCHDCSCSHSEK
jgi:heme iron utilization protein